MLHAMAFAGPLAPLGYLGDAQRVRWGDGARMPRFPDQNLDGVVFLYRTVDEAKNRVRRGATGFMVGRPVPGAERVFGARLHLPYLISNRHVVYEGSACVASVNRRDGGSPDVWDIDQNDWIVHPDGDDVAAVCVFGHINKAIHKFTFIEDRHFLAPSDLAEMNIGVGDDVFMVGRFVNHSGTHQNEPALRFGNISVGLTEIPVRGPTGAMRNQLSFAVEMRSRTGFSGSPVCVYRAAGSSMVAVPESADNFWGLLGVNWGYILDEDGENTWLNGVVPAWKITELLDTPALRAPLEKAAADIAQMPALTTVTPSGLVA